MPTRVLELLALKENHPEIQAFHDRIKEDVVKLEELDWDIVWELMARRTFCDSWGSSEYLTATLDALNRGTIMAFPNGRLVFTRRIY